MMIGQKNKTLDGILGSFNKALDSLDKFIDKRREDMIAAQAREIQAQSDYQSTKAENVRAQKVSSNIKALLATD